MNDNPIDKSVGWKYCTDENIYCAFRRAPDESVNGFLRCLFKTEYRYNFCLLRSILFFELSH